MKPVRMFPVVASFFLLIFIASSTPFAYVSPYVSPKTSGSPSPLPSPAGIVVKYHDENQVRLAISNTGQIGSNLVTGNAAGFWPGNTRNSYVFGSGLWIGGIADIDGDGFDDQLFLNAYDPISGGSEFDAGRYGQSPDDPLASVFRSTDPLELAQWPGEFRAVDSDPNSPTYGQSVPLVMSDQDLVTIYNSVDATPLFGKASPPIEIRQRSLAFKQGLSGQAILFLFDIDNLSDRIPGMEPFTLEEAWLGFLLDVDIGDEFADDRTSFFQVQVTPEGDSIPVNMGFAWDGDFNETNFVGNPGFVGIAYLQSPGNDRDGIDNDRDGLIDESPFNGIDDDGDGEIDDQPDEVDQLGLVNYTVMCGSCPLRSDPRSDREGYRVMSCKPPEECVETTEAQDVRFMISSGPFRIMPGESHRILLAFVFAHAVGDPSRINVYGDPPRPDPNDPVFGEFLRVKQTLQGVWAYGFAQAGPPPRPAMTLIPGDGQITVLWDDGPVHAADPMYNDYAPLDPEYRKYDFEGFRLWRSRTGNYSTAGDPDDPLNPLAAKENEVSSDYDLSLLGQWDLNNGIQTFPEGVNITDSLRDNTGGLVILAADTFDLGTDTGLRFAYVDRGESGAPLVNGFRYFYSIESYDYNSPALPVSAVSLHNGIAFPPENSSIPRSNASSFVQSGAVLDHVDPTGEPIADDTPGVITLEEYKALSPGATDALTGYQISTLVDADIADTYNDLVVDGITANPGGASATVTFHIDDVAREKLYIGGETAELFTLNYDSTASSLVATVFNPADSTVPLYEVSMNFLTSSAFHQSPPVTDLTAVDVAGNDVTPFEPLQIPAGQFNELGFRGTDIEVTWHAAGTDSLTLSVYDTGNQVSVPYAGDVRVQGMNWFFDTFGGQPGGRYLVGTPAVFRVYISGSMIAAVGVSRLPEEGDVWTLKQRSYSDVYPDTTISGSDTTIVEMVVPEGRPLVEGTRYRVTLTGGGQEAGDIDLSKIKVVPNPYLGTARFEFGPDERKIQFINLPPACTIRIYTISGVLVRVLDHTSNEGGTEDYDLRTREGLKLASGNYYFHVTTRDGQTHLGRFAVIR